MDRKDRTRLAQLLLAQTLHLTDVVATAAGGPPDVEALKASQGKLLDALSAFVVGDGND